MQWIAIAIALTLASLVLMLKFGSPELTWDEADYLAPLRWHAGFSNPDWARHNHGPLGGVLSYAGYRLIPDWLLPVEMRVRLPIALLGSLGIAGIYVVLRTVFHSSQSASILPAVLLLTSYSRIAETYIVGPHHLILLCIVLTIGLGYRFLHEPKMWQGILLGFVFGFGALAMTYTVPLGICWLLAAALGTGWVFMSKKGVELSWPLLAVLLTALATLAVFWPRGIFNIQFLTDFLAYAKFPPSPVLVGKTLYLTAPRWVTAHWLATLEAPSLLALGAILVLAYRRVETTALARLPEVRYTGLFALFLFLTFLTAHKAGPRNILPFLTAFSLVLGVAFDRLKVRRQGWKILLSIGLQSVAVGFLAYHLARQPFPSTVAVDGFRALLQENRELLQRPGKALVNGAPIFHFYREEQQVPTAWKIEHLRFTPERFELSPAVRFVVVGGRYRQSMLPGHPIGEVSRTWKLRWVRTGADGRDLRVYERP